MTGRRSHGRLSALNGVVHQGTSATRRRWSRSRSISPAPPPTSTSGRDIHTGTLDDEWQGADCLTCQDGTTTRKVPLTARVVISKQYHGKDLCLSRDAESPVPLTHD